MLRWVSVAPFATPVVPPVYCRKASSSAVSTASRCGRRRPWASASRNRIAPGIEKAGTSFLTYFTAALTMNRFGARSRSPSSVTTTLGEPISARTSSRLCAKLATMTTALTPASFIWCAISRGV